MTETYFYVDIPYHRPAAVSPLRLLQRWAGPLLLGAVLAAIAWHQDHPQPQDHLTAAAGASHATVPALANPVAPATEAALSPATPSAAESLPAVAAAPQSAAHPQGAHPALVFHNCSVPHMTVRKDPNDFITGVATISSCDEAKVTLWDTSR